MNSPCAIDPIADARPFLCLVHRSFPLWLLREACGVPVRLLGCDRARTRRKCARAVVDDGGYSATSPSVPDDRSRSKRGQTHRSRADRATRDTAIVRVFGVSPARTERTLEAIETAHGKMIETPLVANSIAAPELGIGRRLNKARIAPTAYERPHPGEFVIFKWPVTCSAPGVRMGQGPRFVLVIDDNAEMRQALTFVLEAEGYMVVVAGDGLEALAYLRQELLPGVILLDLSMPNMDGRAFRRRQLGDPRLASIPVVVFSGEPAGEETARRLGTEGYLPKPVDADRVLEAVHRFCP